MTRPVVLGYVVLGTLAFVIALTAGGVMGFVLWLVRP